MKLFDRFSAAVAAFRGSKPTNLTAPSASPTPFGTGTRTGTNATFSIRQLNEMTPYDRAQAIKDSTFVFNRLGLGRGIVKSCGRYAIDGGLIPYAVSGDQGYDDSCNKFLDDIFESNRIDVTEERDFYGMQQVGAMAVMVKGDCGAAKILPRDANGRIIGEPQLQLFQSEQIGNGGMFSLTTNSDWREGIQYDALNRRVRYRVLKTPSLPMLSYIGTDRWFEYKARDFIFWLDAERIDQGRGMPWLQTGTNSAMRTIDLVELESKVALLNSFFGAYIKTPTGELPEGFEHEVARKRVKTGKDEKTDDTKEKSGARQYAEFFGGAAMPVLADGEEIGFYENKRPSLTFTGFIDWLAADIASGFGVPLPFVWALAGRTGPEVRFTLNQGDWFFRHIARLTISRFAKPVRDWFIDYGILTGKINGGRVPNNGASPYLARWQLPRKASIDERYFFKTWMDRIDKGLGTEEDFYADLGGAGDAAHFRRTRALEVKHWMELSKELGVPLPLLLRQTPGQNMFDPHDLANAQQQADELNAA